ncbi:aldo/keto reductase [Psychrobacillus sp. MER TA 171]|uniref:aldo/keto reductase n=1 Tax=Psychrobacillus sp. MER TA 171 TaxID=2939577 RepID=UPI002041B2E3|nr:aldo/keto reductase [Psychrobacillus sp. MER TA 171]MCM3357170.1 aldo/keto reductase [Psychrobacillus sp. MER TA 171]
MIKGFASRENTFGYLSRHQSNFRETPWFYCSPIAIGTHLGEMTEDHSVLYQETIRYCLLNGLNFIDTALNYRGMKSERDIGKVLLEITENKKLNRSEFVLSTKGGLLPGDKDAGLVPKDYLESVLLQNKIIKETDIQTVETQKHVLTPNYFRFALEQSRKHLHLDTIDIYYLHVPELSMKVLGKDAFYNQLEDLFYFFEEQVDKQTIRFYGMATWLGLIGDQDEKGYISLEIAESIARNVGGEDHHFRFVQLPVNRVFPEAIKKKTQSVAGIEMTVLEVARQLGMHVTTSAPFNLGKDIQKTDDSLRFLMDTKGILSTMVGMKQIDHAKQNIATSKRRTIQ